jgi:hypothetical protein
VNRHPKFQSQATLRWGKAPQTMISGRSFIHFRLDVLIEPFLRCFSSSQASRIQYRANRCSGSLQRYVSWRVSSSFQPCFCRKSIMSRWECLSKVPFIGLVFFQASAQETSYGCDSLPVTHVTHSRRSVRDASKLRCNRRRHPLGYFRPLSAPHFLHLRPTKLLL